MPWVGADPMDPPPLFLNPRKDNSMYKISWFHKSEPVYMVSNMRRSDDVLGALASQIGASVEATSFLLSLFIGKTLSYDTVTYAEGRANYFKFKGSTLPRTRSIFFL